MNPARIPEDVWYEIIDKLSPKVYYLLLRVCKKWKRIVSTKNVQYINNETEFMQAIERNDNLGVSRDFHVFDANVFKSGLQECINHNNLALYLYICSRYKVITNFKEFLNNMELFYINFWEPDLSKRNIIFKYQKEIKTVLYNISCSQWCSEWRIKRPKGSQNVGERTDQEFLYGRIVDTTDHLNNVMLNKYVGVGLNILGQGVSTIQHDRIEDRIEKFLIPRQLHFESLTHTIYTRENAIISGLWGTCKHGNELVLISGNDNDPENKTIRVQDLIKLEIRRIRKGMTNHHHKCQNCKKL